MLEVEQKFPCDDLARVRAAALALGAAAAERVTQRDRYFNHPERDFAQTDEALRIRSVGEQNFVTYKGPKLDPHTKTRVEQEVALADGPAAAATADALLLSLGFRPVAVVSKNRELLHLQVAGQAVELALDAVEGVGQFVEIEILADAADAASPVVAAARASLAELARQLDLGASERRSYLELLLARGK